MHPNEMLNDKQRYQAFMLKQWRVWADLVGLKRPTKHHPFWEHSSYSLMSGLYAAIAGKPLTIMAHVDNGSAMLFIDLADVLAAAEDDSGDATRKEDLCR